MAAYASDMVGVGIATGKAIDVFVDAGAMNVVYPRSLQTGTRVNTTDLDLMLIQGNKAVYRDIYWQHLAYREAGVDELLGLIDKLPGKRTDLLRNGWTLIARGDRGNNQGLIWQGNERLLQYEQMVTLQPVYNKFHNLSTILSAVMISPLPFQWGFLQASQLGKKHRRLSGALEVDGVLRFVDFYLSQQAVGYAEAVQVMDRFMMQAGLAEQFDSREYEKHMGKVEAKELWCPRIALEHMQLWPSLNCDWEWDEEARAQLREVRCRPYISIEPLDANVADAGRVQATSPTD